MASSLMIQGAGSNVGKSMLVAGLARALTRRGLKVLPFKPQNMSNNAAVTTDGGEIGRAQALQALACNVEPVIDMNPVLLKPETETGAQVVVHGKRLTTVKARDYASLKPQLMDAVLSSFNRLQAQADIVLVEGAGSPAEVNLRAGDIANMGFARAADVPVILTGDIDRGGVIAQLVGTQHVIDPEDAAMITGFLVNKFRGDTSLFGDGYELIEQQTGWTGYGVIPWFGDAHKLPAEDALDIGGTSGTGDFKVVCPVLSRIANFDDLDPLKATPGVSVEMVRAGNALPGDADLIILPGSKSTRGDLEFLRQQGWDIDIAAHVRRGGHVLGLCGGYQMLGRTIADPDGIEGAAGITPGLDLLDVETTMIPDKTLTRITAKHIASNCDVTGYEIHIGRTDGPDRVRPMLEIDGRTEGAMSADGRIMGSYVHGIFGSDDFRTGFVNGLGAATGVSSYDKSIDTILNNLAEHLEAHANIDGLLDVARKHSRGASS
ncbi:cobyric acid synthase [Anderseniella sp. Alg231-50]|uniref:cobyric acid synthase n=1 Tax=Anderseniella sp. Alg231-50 TaxID=1922226 RepID=UPI000D54FD8D